MTSYRMHRLTMIAGQQQGWRSTHGSTSRCVAVQLSRDDDEDADVVNEEENEGQRGIMNNQLEYGREGTLYNNQLERREKSYVGRGTRDINEDNEEQKINYL